MSESTLNPFVKHGSTKPAQLCVDVPSYLRDEIDELAGRADLKRSAMTRQLLTLGLEAAKKLLSEAGR